MLLCRRLWRDLLVCRVMFLCVARVDFSIQSTLDVALLASRGDRLWRGCGSTPTAAGAGSCGRGSLFGAGWPLLPTSLFRVGSPCGTVWAGWLQGEKSKLPGFYVVALNLHVLVCRGSMRAAEVVNA